MVFQDSQWFVSVASVCGQCGLSGVTSHVLSGVPSPVPFLSFVISDMLDRPGGRFRHFSHFDFLTSKV